MTGKYFCGKVTLEIHSAYFCEIFLVLYTHIYIQIHITLSSRCLHTPHSPLPLSALHPTALNVSNTGVLTVYRLKGNYRLLRGLNNNHQRPLQQRQQEMPKKQDDRKNFIYVNILQKQTERQESTQVLSGVVSGDAEV